MLHVSITINAKENNKIIDIYVIRAPTKETLYLLAIIISSLSEWLVLINVLRACMVLCAPTTVDILFINVIKYMDVHQVLFLLCNML